MAPTLPRILLGIVVAVIGVDCVWQSIDHFDVDVPAYLFLGGAAFALWLGGLFYEYIRKDTRLSGMLLGTSFLVVFSSGFGVLNYFLLTVAGTQVDDGLAAADRAMGVNWPAMMEFAADHPIFNGVLFYAYTSMLPQIAFLVLCLGWKGRRDEIDSFCFALASSAFLTVFVWTLFPSFGAFSVYTLPANVEARLSLALDSHYAHSLIDLLTNGPHRITPKDVKGLIGFPSFHIVSAILITWYARCWKVIFVPLVLLNCVVLVATPIQGGHHVIDVLGGIVVAVLAIGFVRAVAAAGAGKTVASPEAYAGIPAE